VNFKADMIKINDTEFNESRQILDLLTRYNHYRIDIEVDNYLHRIQESISDFEHKKLDIIIPHWKSINANLSKKVNKNFEKWKNHCLNRNNNVNKKLSDIKSNIDYRIRLIESSNDIKEIQRLLTCDVRNEPFFAPRFYTVFREKGEGFFRSATLFNSTRLNNKNDNLIFFSILFDDYYPVCINREDIDGFFINKDKIIFECKAIDKECYNYINLKNSEYKNHVISYKKICDDIKIDQEIQKRNRQKRIEQERKQELELERQQREKERIEEQTKKRQKREAQEHREREKKRKAEKERIEQEKQQQKERQKREIEQKRKEKEEAEYKRIAEEKAERARQKKWQHELEQQRIKADSEAEERLKQREIDALKEIELQKIQLERERMEFEQEKEKMELEREKMAMEIRKMELEKEMADRKKEQAELRMLREQAQYKGIYDNIESLKDYQKKG